MKPYTLQWWMYQYNRCIMEQDSACQDEDYIREYFGSPDPEVLKDINDRIHRYHYLRKFIEERIIKKYGE